MTGSQIGSSSGSGGEAWQPDARLHPWLMIEHADHQCLFGFALRHPVTGGLAWTLSTPVVVLHSEERRAVTESGRRYELGEQLAGPTQLPTEEGRVAYAILVLPLLGLDPAEALGGRTVADARLWVTAQKVARHLNIPPPKWDMPETHAFLERHSERYTRLMRARRRV